MKKMILMLSILLLAGCHPLDRVNPTDPLGTKYGGMTYLGEIGSFDLLTDFTIANDPGDGKYYIFAVDGSKEEINKYGVDGTPVEIIPNPPTPVFFNPTGICEQNGYCYIIDTVNTVAFHMDNILIAWQDNTVKGNKIMSYNNTLYTTVSDPPGVALFNSDVITKAYTPVTTWAITKGNSLCASCMSYISDIAVHPSTNEIMLVDSALKRISIFTTTAGVHVRNIDIGSDITSAALWEPSDILYVPTTDGIKRYNYTSGAYIDTIADYGDGNGKIMKPGPIKLYLSAADGKYYIFVGAGSFIKVFQRDGL